MIVIAPAANAATPVDISGCKASTVTGAEMGHYPAWPGSQSALRVACIFNAKVGDVDANPNLVSSKFTIHDFSNVQYHNGAARTVTGTTSGSTLTISSSTADLGTFVNRSISGPGLAPRTFVKSIVGATATLNVPVTTGSTGSFKIDNSTARSVKDATTNGTTTLTSASANFTVADEGASVTGTDIPDGTTIVSPGGFVSPTQVTMTNASVTDPPPAPPFPHVNQVITIGGTQDILAGPTAALGKITSTRTVNDGTYTATTINSPAADFKASDIGLPVSGTGIAANCFIHSFAGATATLSSACVTNVGTAGLNVFTIGDPTATAPTNGESALNQQVQLDLNPTLVAGSGPCSADEAEGFGIAGTWANPANGTAGFVGGAFATQPGPSVSSPSTPGTKAIGEIVFKTSVITYGAYVIERKAATAGDPIGAIHYDLVFPNVPTTLALCSSATSPGLGFSVGLPATTPSVAGLATGVGRPGTAQLRSTRASTTGSNSTIYITSDDGVHTWAGTEFNRFCSIPATTPDVNFVCGDG